MLEARPAAAGALDSADVGEARDVRHVALLVPLFRFVQGRRRSWYCGAHTRVNSTETCFVAGLAAASQIGADYPFNDANAREVFNYCGGILNGTRFRRCGWMSTRQCIEFAYRRIGGI